MYKINGGSSKVTLLQNFFTSVTSPTETVGAKLTVTELAAYKAAFGDNAISELAEEIKRLPGLVIEGTKKAA